MTGRPIARFVATAGLLVLGGTALARLPLDYLPRRSFPELTVGLSLPETRDLAEVTRRWVEPVESAVRSLGRVRATGGEVRGDGAELTVRFAPGTDPDRKAARLESELARLRSTLPEGAALWVAPASGREGEFLAVVWLAGVRDDASARAAAEEIRSVPGVRAVELFGARDAGVRVEIPGTVIDAAGLAARIRSEVSRALRVPALGRFERAGRRWSVVEERREDLRSLPIPVDGGAVPLGGLAALRSGWQPPRAEVRFQGEPARALFVWRAPGYSLLAVDRALRERLGTLPGGARGRVAWSDADPLRVLLRRLGLAGLLAVVLSATLGAWIAGGRGALSLALAVPAALAAAANAFLLAGIPLNVTTLLALTLGTLSLVPLAALRLARGDGFWRWGLTAVAAAATVPMAVALASSELGPLLLQPALALVIAVGTGVVAVGILPGSGGREPRVRAGERGLRTALRDPGTIVLFAATGAWVLTSLYGAALVPRPGNLEPDQGNLTLLLRTPEGAPLAETVERVKQAEHALAKREEIASFWSSTTAGAARIVAELRPAERAPQRRARLVTLLRYDLAAVGPVDIAAGSRPAGSRTGGFLDELEDRPETDEEALAYRVVLRSADLAALRTGYERLLHRLETLAVRRHWIAGWGEPAVHFHLRPRPGTAPREAAEIAAALRWRSTPPPTLRLPDAATGGRRVLSVVPAGAPSDPDAHVPQAAELFGRPLRSGGREVVPAAALEVAESVLHPRVSRQSGRFVLPVEIRIGYNAEDLRIDRREKIDRSLGQLPLPAGCALDRPALASRFWHRERLRILLLAVAVPLLLFAVAACRLDSAIRALAALAPLGLGALAALPLVAASLGQADELTVFALAASLALVLPSAAEAVAAPIATGGRLYRSLRGETAWLLGAIPVLLLALAAPTLGADPAALPWALPLRAAAVAGGAALAASVLVAPALAFGAARLRDRDPAEVRRRRHPPAWSEAGEPVLEARSLTRIYGGRGRRVGALDRVSFTLTPGIVGLLGPNGAGKTTLLRILTGLLEPTRGEVAYRGIPLAQDNLAEYRRRIGFLPQEFNAYPGFTAEEFLDHWARERGLADPRRRGEEIARLLAAVGLAEHAGRKVRDYSGGMRQRIGIARALLGAPPVLIVDEPTTGLDVESRHRFRRTLLEAAADRIVVFSTHIASDVEAAALRLLLLHRGRLRFDGPPEELIARARGRVFRALVDEATLAELGRLYRVTSRVRVLEGIQVRALARPGDTLPGEPLEPNLEEAYLAEIDLADAEAGRERRVDRFAFLGTRQTGFSPSPSGRGPG